MSAALATAPPVVRVMIVDDSAVVRAAFARMLQADPRIDVVARVADGQAALDAMGRRAVDVVVLDVEMPGMDGMTALPRLLAARPSLRVVMASELTRRGAEITLRALRLGAADYVAKPNGAAIADDSFRRELVEKIVGLAAGPPARAAISLRAGPASRPVLLAIGSSTGGPQALFQLVPGLGPDLSVPVVLAQHMPAGFTKPLAESLAKLGGPACVEAQDDQELLAGRIHVAPGGRHLLVRAEGLRLRAHLSDAPPEHFCRPAVDPLLRSANGATGGRVLVAMLTGMGQDGLAGTREVVAAGGCAVAQDAASSVVWGMPGAIALAGLCHAVLPLDAMARKLRALLGMAAR